MVRPINPELIRLRDKYPVARSLTGDWARIKKLVDEGKADEAEALIKDRLASSPRLRIRARVIKSTLSGRRIFLRAQRDLENQVKHGLSDLSDLVSDLLIAQAGPDGKISPGRLTRINDAIRKMNTEAWAAILISVKAGVRSSIKKSLSVNMGAAQDGLDAKKAIEMDMPISEVSRGEIQVGSQIYRTIFNRVKARQLEKGLFANRYRGQYRSGTTLSRRVWDVRDQSLRRLRQTVSAGIAQGRPATAISGDVRGQTLAGPTSRYMPEPGRGVYRSAYKNALRMVRTETNNAYVDAQLEYSIQKGYKVLWNLSPGHPEEDECDDLAGKVYDPEGVPYPNHPNEACFLTTVLPEIG